MLSDVIVLKFWLGTVPTYLSSQGDEARFTSNHDKEPIKKAINKPKRKSLVLMLFSNIILISMVQGERVE